jgi:K+-transporting ATPase ATPase A chain
MSWQNLGQILAPVALLAVTVAPLGRYIAAVYGAREDGSAPGDRLFAPIERLIYRLCRIDDRPTAYTFATGLPHLYAYQGQDRRSCPRRS